MWNGPASEPVLGSTNRTNSDSAAMCSSRIGPLGAGGADEDEDDLEVLFEDPEEEDGGLRVDKEVENGR